MFRRSTFEAGVGELMISENRGLIGRCFVTVIDTVDCDKKNGRCKLLYLKHLQRPFDGIRRERDSNPWNRLHGSPV